MVVKVAYEGPWNKGRIRVEADSISELAETIGELTNSENVRFRSMSASTSGEGESTASYPSIPGNVGCAEAIRVLLSSDWGRAEGRTESELTVAMKASAIHYPRGTVSGLLTSLTRRGDLRRIGKKNGSYAYVIVDGQP